MELNMGLEYFMKMTIFMKVPLKPLNSFLNCKNYKKDILRMIKKMAKE